MADDSAHERINDLTTRLHALEIEHVELRGDVRSRVARMEQRLESFADSHTAQTEKLDRLLSMGAERDKKVEEIKTAVNSMAPHIELIKDGTVIWRFVRWPVYAAMVAAGATLAENLNMPQWIKNLFK